RPGVGRRDPLDDRESEGERLARARGGLRKHVEACNCVRQDELLNPERLADRTTCEYVNHRRGHAELAERFLGHLVVRLLCGFETCLARDTRRRNEKLISPG